MLLLLLFYPPARTCAVQRCCSPSVSGCACLHPLPLCVQAGRPSRVVHVSSKVHYMGSLHRQDMNLERGYNSLAAYGQSKLAQVRTEGGGRMSGAVGRAIVGEE